MKLALFPIGDKTVPVGDVTLAGLVFALFSWFMLGAGPFEFFLPTRLSKSMLTLPTSLLQVEPRAIGFFDGCSTGMLLLVELLKIELDGWRMLSARNWRRTNH